MVEWYCGCFDSPIGMLKITASEEELLGIEFVDSKFEVNQNQIIFETVLQLKEYFEGVRQVFDLPYSFSGSDFARKAQHALVGIPFGETISYKEQAAIVGNSNAARAVGGANNKNKIAVVIPCHRVVGKNGNLTGYAGGLSRKKLLIEHEKRVKNEKF